MKKFYYKIYKLDLLIGVENNLSTEYIFKLLLKYSNYKMEHTRGLILIV